MDTNKQESVMLMLGHNNIADWQYFLDRQVGKRYLKGAECPLKSQTVVLNHSPWDCSEMAQGAFFYTLGKIIIDGSSAQYAASLPIGKRDPQPGDLGFKKKNGIVHHVCCVYDRAHEVEARSTKDGVVKRTLKDFASSGEFAGWRRIKDIGLWTPKPSPTATVTIRYIPHSGPTTKDFMDAVEKYVLEHEKSLSRLPMTVVDGHVECRCAIRYADIVRAAMMRYPGVFV